MKRIYLSPTGAVRWPTTMEYSHYGIALTELGPGWSGGAEDAYVEMWNRGWVRVMDYGAKLYAARYVDGRPVKLADLTRSQREWLKDAVISGKTLIWNDKLWTDSN